MNFTREPIIETIISPRDGCKLIVRNSKAGSREEYTVDAVEVVSFGHSFFYRSLERPRSFLLPVSDYEVLESKETRVVLKNAPTEKAIKIGGGKEPSHKAPIKETHLVEAEREEVLAGPSEIPASEGETPENKTEPRFDNRKRDRRRSNRRRRGPEEHITEAQKQAAMHKIASEHAEHPSDKPQHTEDVKGGGNPDEAQVSSPIFRGLFPPPKTLISETINRQKILESSERVILSEPIVPAEHPHPVLEPVVEATAYQEETFSSHIHYRDDAEAIDSKKEEQAEDTL